MRSIVRRVSLKQLSLRNIPSNFIVNLDRVRIELDRRTNIMYSMQWKDSVKNTGAKICEEFSKEVRVVKTLHLTTS